MVALSRRDDPIIAIATAPGRGAVGVIRVSGRPLQSFVSALCHQQLKPRTAHLLNLRDEHQQHIDQVLALYFPAPHSYTGEDVLELQGHGGPVVLQMLLQHCLAVAKQLDPNGQIVLPQLRLAEPGEFTERAYLNQKMDLAQAEAVADLIDATTRAAAISAGRSLEGVFSQKINALLDSLVQVRMQIEACIDFPEEDIEFIEKLQIKEQLKHLVLQVEQLLQEAEQGKLLRDGLKLVIAGQPNAGKSSLLNALSGADTAIVTDIEGTTRDVLSELIQIQGVPIHVLDTAGLRDSDQADPVERIGIERAWQQIEQADVVLLLNDLSRAQQTEFIHKQNRLMEEIKRRVSAGTPVLQVDNKADLLQQASNEHTQALVISAKTGSGIEKLRQTILETAGWRQDQAVGTFSARQRHVQALQQVMAHVATALELMQLPTITIELLAEECRLAQNQLSQITGQYTTEDLLGEIFSRFCIGK